MTKRAVILTEIESSCEGYAFGACLTVESVLETAPQRLDFIELPGWQLLAIGNSDYRALQALAERTPITTCNQLFAGDVSFATDEGRASALSTFTRLIERARTLGVRRYVVGSGCARAVPPGADVACHRDDAGRLIAQMASVAAERDCLLLIEPLQAAECNWLRTVRECDSVRSHLADGCPVGLCVDNAHVALDPARWPTEAAWAADVHIHVSGPGRTPITPGSSAAAAGYVTSAASHPRARTVSTEWFPPSPVPESEAARSELIGAVAGAVS